MLSLPVLSKKNLSETMCNYFSNGKIDFDSVREQNPMLYRLIGDLLSKEFMDDKENGKKCLRVLYYTLMAVDYQFYGIRDVKAPMNIAFNYMLPNEPYFDTDNFHKELEEIING